MKLIFRLLLMGVQNLKPAELYQNVLQLIRVYFGSARIQMFTPQIA